MVWRIKSLYEYLGQCAYYIRLQCPHEKPGDCSPACRHWRSNILRACKASGGAIPTESDFICEAMLHVSEPSYYGVPHNLSFRPPRDQLGSNTPERMAQSLTTLYTVDQDYQATMDLVAKTFSRLPAHWHSLYRKEKGEGRNWREVVGAIETVFEEIRPSLSLLPNSDCHSSWIRNYS